MYKYIEHHVNKNLSRINNEESKMVHQSYKNISHIKFVKISINIVISKLQDRLTLKNGFTTLAPVKKL